MVAIQWIAVDAIKLNPGNARDDRPRRPSNCCKRSMSCEHSCTGVRAHEHPVEAPIRKGNAEIPNGGASASPNRSPR